MGLGVILLGLMACRPRTATVRVTIPDFDGKETAVPQLMVTFLPYDRDSIVAALEAAAPPRPHVAALDSLFAVFRPRYQAAAVAGARVEAAVLARAELVRGQAPAGDLAAADAALAALRAEQRLARQGLDSVRSALGPTIDRLRREVAQWEDSALGSYRSIVRSLGDRVFANPVADTTSSDGWASAELTDGSWWVTALTIDPTDPNREWYWNLKLDRDTVYLSPRTGRNRPRY